MLSGIFFLLKFRFVEFISKLYHKNNDTVYHFRNIQCRYFYPHLQRRRYGGPSRARTVDRPVMSRML